MTNQMDLSVPLRLAFSILVLICSFVIGKWVYRLNHKKASSQFVVEEGPIAVDALSPGKNGVRALNSADSKSSDAGATRIFVRQTPAQLKSLGNDLLGIHRERLIEPFIGKWLKVRGEISNITTIGSNTVRVYLNAEHNLMQHYFDFSASNWSDRLMLLAKNDYLTVIGKIEYIGKFELGLVDCEIVDGDTVTS